MTRVVVISPPFASHATPMATLAAALASRGVDVVFACAPEFRVVAAAAGVPFTALTFGDGANTGIAQRTTQSGDARDRLTEFLDATRRGAGPALLTQARHRGADMLSEPQATLRAVRVLDERYRPDWYLVDQLAYAVTLALYCLDRPWATFCPGHPSYLVHRDDQLFGLPAYWPDAVRPGAGELAAVEAAARDNDRAFTKLFAEVAAECAPRRPRPERAFALTSSRAVVLNYTDLPWLPELPGKPVKIFLGHCGTAGPYRRGALPLARTWRHQVDRLTGGGRRKLVLVSFGTFLSARDDVLRTVAEGILLLDDVALIVSAGDRAPELADLTRAADRVLVEATVPQRALLPYVDAMVHHGGNNSFTEALAAGVPALVLPFSSDQFSIAHDLVLAAAGVCLDPNRLTAELAAAAVDSLLTRPHPELAGLTERVRAAGPAAGVADLLSAMGT
ncbi:glycosyltransferase [Amycolatopsis sp. H20-H5]|uniref:glycosyltransferase n=1 Tax=Amycolatopsis sp. H20-H5 TaxID=3046309 RepID=UPI002DB9F0AB|nr:glycosyltransferase [Amycolatopsis sp. H20-H5]MEC3976410.1 glycosyltransferase [Amycolatopsis sp. H20-H5]